MRIQTRFVLVAWIWVAGFVAPVGAFTEGVDVTVFIKDIRNNKGQVLVALHNDPKAFPTKPDRAVQKVRLPIQSDPFISSSYFIKYTFHDVVPGTYAVTTVHDENLNDDIDLFLFFPTEGYGTSKNVRGMFGPPHFRDAKFSVATADVTIPIMMGY
jgi:uncharacterized protein (DUF2141 family)